MGHTVEVEVEVIATVPMTFFTDSTDTTGKQTSTDSMLLGSDSHNKFK